MIERKLAEELRKLIREVNDGYHENAMAKLSVNLLRANICTCQKLLCFDPIMLANVPNIGRVSYLYLTQIIEKLQENGWNLKYKLENYRDVYLKWNICTNIYAKQDYKRYINHFKNVSDEEINSIYNGPELPFDVLSYSCR